jgi:hypothetical protein
VPGFEKVNENDDPGDRSGDVQVTASPESAVQVWVVESLLVTVTFVPDFTFSGVGLKAKLLMVTADPPAAAAGAAAVDPVAVVVLDALEPLLLELQAPRSATEATEAVTATRVVLAERRARRAGEVVVLMPGTTHRRPRGFSP